jgi:hypothetical protein
MAHQLPLLQGRLRKSLLPLATVCQDVHASHRDWHGSSW